MWNCAAAAAAQKENHKSNLWIYTSGGIFCNPRARPLSSVVEKSIALSQRVAAAVDAKAISRASHSLVQHLLPLKKMNTHNPTRNNKKKRKRERERERDKMCFHKQADMSPDCWCVYYLRNLAIMQRMRTRIFKVSLLSFTELLWSPIFMIAESVRGCSIEWPRARTVEGKVSSGSGGQLSPYRLNYYNITTLSYCSLCV